MLPPCFLSDKKKPDPRPMGSTMAARKAEKRRERAQKRKQVYDKILTILYDGDLIMTRWYK